MTLLKRGNTYHADIRAGKRPAVRRSLKTGDCALAKERYDALLRQTLDPEFGIDAVQSLTFREAFRKLMVTRPQWVRAKAPETIRGNYNKVAAVIGEDLPLSEVDDEVIDDLLTELRGAGASDSTVNAKLSILRVCLEFAVERRVIKYAPKLPHYQQATGRIRFYSEAEEVALFGGLRCRGDAASQEMADLVMVLVDTGMRLSEGLRGEARDFNAEAGTLSIWANKASLPRTVPLTARSRLIVAARAALGPHLFPLLNKDRAEHLWHHARVAAGLLEDNQAVLHTLRHTCASRLVQGGMDLRRVQVWLGHKTIQTTMLYAHLAPSHLRDCVDVLDARHCVAGVSQQDTKQPVLRVAGKGGQR